MSTCATTFNDSEIVSECGNAVSSKSLIASTHRSSPQTTPTTPCSHPATSGTTVPHFATISDVIAPQCASKKPATVHFKPNDFHYDVLDPGIEEDFRYRPGGYHPIVVGDILGKSPERQYRIMHKLGCGSYSTVWLAQRTDQPNAFVSLKVTTANDETQSQEVQMLQKVNQSQPHVVTLLDHFKLHGPNGIHTVIVTDVVVPFYQLRSRQTPAWRKAVAYGLVQAITQLHADGIVHGDLHIGNIGIAMPQLAHQNHKAVMQDLGEHEMTVLLTYDPEKQTASLPAYLILPCKLGAYYRTIAGTEPPQTKILDFGSAHAIGTQPHALQCAVHVSAPEIVFPCFFEMIDNPSFDAPADVWSLGATIYEIVAGSALFSGVGMPGMPSKMAQLGRVPPHWEQWITKLPDRKILDATKWWASQWEMPRRGCENDEDANALIRLLKRVLILDPAERPTAAEILKDPWFHSIPAASTVHPQP